MPTSHAAAIIVFTAISIGMTSACKSELPNAKPAPIMRAVGPLRVSTKPGIGSLWAGPMQGKRTRAIGNSGIFSFCRHSVILPRYLKMLNATAMLFSFGNSWQYSRKESCGPAAWKATVTSLNEALSSALRARSS